MHKTLSAGAGERVQYLAHKYNDTTIRFILKYPGQLAPDILHAAVQAVIERVDVLHASFVANTSSAHWRVNTNYRTADYFSIVECDGDPVKPARGIALQPIKHDSLCQLHVTLIHGTDSCAVVVRISHLVVDGSDGKYLLNKIAEGYRLIEQTGNTAQLAVKNGSRSAVQAYQEYSLKDLRSLMKMPFSGVKTDYPFADPNTHGAHRMLYCTVPAEQLSAARKKAKDAGATVNDLFMTACYHSYAKAVRRQGPMSLSAMVDLRQHCKDGTSEGLANMSGGLSTTLDASPGSSFTSDLQSIVMQTKTAKENPLAGLDGIPLLHTATRLFPMWVLLQAADIVYGNLSLSITNLGNIPCAPLAMGGAAPVTGIFGGPLKAKPSVQVGVASFDGAAALSILGDFVTEDLPSLQTFLDGIPEELEAYLRENTPRSQGWQAAF